MNLENYRLAVFASEYASRREGEAHVADASEGAFKAATIAGEAIEAAMAAMAATVAPSPSAQTRAELLLALAVDPPVELLEAAARSLRVAGPASSPNPTLREIFLQRLMGGMFAHAGVTEWQAFRDGVRLAARLVLDQPVESSPAKETDECATGCPHDPPHEAAREDCDRRASRDPPRDPWKPLPASHLEDLDAEAEEEQ